MEKTPVKFAVTLLFLALVGGVSWYSGYTQGLRVAGGPNGLTPLSPQEMRSLNGFVESSQGTSIVIRIPQQNPDADSNLALRTVSFSPDTVITRFIERDPAVFKKEQDAFVAAQKNQPTDATPLNAPSPFEEKKATAADIKKGDMVLVSASADIATMTAFEAVRVTIMPPLPSQDSTATQ